jgi:hypothetical protein
LGAVVSQERQERLLPVVVPVVPVGRLVRQERVLPHQQR